jgi:hypothetical protein
MPDAIGRVLDVLVTGTIDCGNLGKQFQAQKRTEKMQRHEVYIRGGVEMWSGLGSAICLWRAVFLSGRTLRNLGTSARDLVW